VTLPSRFIQPANIQTTPQQPRNARTKSRAQQQLLRPVMQSAQTPHSTPDHLQTSANRFRKSGKPRIALTEELREDHCTPESFRMKCVGKSCCAA